MTHWSMGGALGDSCLLIGGVMGCSCAVSIGGGAETLVAVFIEFLRSLGARGPSWGLSGVRLPPVIRRLLLQLCG